MSTFEALVVGLVQGLTEFLPISSSGHLIVVPWLFGWDEPGLSFDAALHLGTLLAVFIYFWRELFAMVLAVPTALSRPLALLRSAPSENPETSVGPPQNRESDARLALLLIVGSIPGGIVGLLAQGAIEDYFHSDSHRTLSIVVIAILLMGFGLLLWWADRTASLRRRIGAMTVRDTVTIGIAQAMALVPGVSRSGATLTAGLFLGLRRADAARFSFLLGTPLVTLAGLKGVNDILGADPTGTELRMMAIGMVTSAISGFAAISVLLRYLQRSSTVVFVIYRLVAGLFLLGVIVTGIR
jgi:undecaprenyl-diphosphatase